MANLILATIASYGLCHIIMYGEIVSLIRKELTKIQFFKKLLSCALCTGFWTGIFIGILAGYNPLLFCFYSAATCYIINLCTDILADKAYSDD